MKIDVIGPEGMLGSAVKKIVDYDKSADVVINCAGVIKHRQVEDAQYIKSNALLPHLLKNDAKRLLHVSTDCVFDGNFSAPYSEDVYPAPVDLYGRSKLAGEVTDSPHLTVRTSFIGFGKRGLLHDLFNQRDTTIKVKKFSLWTGHTATALARILVNLAERKDLTGLLHIPAEAVSRAELIRKLSKAFDLHINVIEVNELGLDRRLISHRWQDIFIPGLKTLDEEIDELAAAYWMEKLK